MTQKNQYPTPKLELHPNYAVLTGVSVPFNSLGETPETTWNDFLDGESE
jgi:hypothetical protein